MTSFPNAGSKGLPGKKSTFERQKDAEAKKARDEAVATAAALAEFEKSFEDQGATPKPFSRPGHAPAGPAYGPGPGKRHFTSSGLKSGPGSLGPTPGFTKKRHYEDYSGRRDRDRVFGLDDRDDRRGRDTFKLEEEEQREREDAAAARPTLHLSNLPPGTSPAVIKALFAPSPLVVEGVRILPATTTDRKALSALVTLAAETPATDIDTMVSHLQNKYLGFGFNLSISRHLSSAALTGAGALSTPGANSNNLPFGAEVIQQQTSLSRAPPPGQSGRFAPPSSYTSSTPYGSRPQSQVIVHPPSDLKQLKLIHKALEALLTYGPEFEALLMSRPEIQRDERWAWLWDPRSQGGVYYRWRLWEILTDSDSRRRSQRLGYGTRPTADALFDGHSNWVVPEQSLKFEYTTKLDDFVSDEDYNSSDEEDDDEGALARRHNDHNIGASTQSFVGEPNEGTGYLNPLAKTKLVHLLSRLPESNAKLRKGDIARITGFAIEHAGTGAQEVAGIITKNLVQPFSFVYQQQHIEPDGNHDGGEIAEVDKDSKDTSPASLVGLYVISDILSSSASAGIRHAWRYRMLFENALRQQKAFERLGRLEKDLAWGKLKAEKWKRSIQNLLSLWEGWSVFPHDKQEAFLDRFLNPPLTDAEHRLAEAEAKRKADEEIRKSKSVNKWRSVEADDTGEALSEDVSMHDVEGSAMAEDDDVDGMAMDEDGLIDENIDGVPMLDSSDEEMGGLENQDQRPVQPPAAPDNPAPPPPPPLPKTELTPKRQRARAVDMFGDADSD